MAVFDNYKQLRSSVPKDIKIIVAAKTRAKEEVAEAIRAGATDIGYNYVQEAEKMQEMLGETAKKVRWHMIGHLQKNKIKKALKAFDVIQTIDSFETAEEIDKRADKAVSVFIEVNIADEKSKYGVNPDEVGDLIQKISKLKNIKIEGLMTMGPAGKDPRPYFKKIKKIFDGLDLKYISMGMSDSYKTAIEEGSNMVRIGRAVFGRR